MELQIINENHGFTITFDSICIDKQKWGLTKGTSIAKEVFGR